MHIRTAKGIDKNWFTVTRTNGTLLSWHWPIEGTLLPHDLCHFVMEQTFGLKRAVWGLIAKGVDWREFHGSGMLQRADEFAHSKIGGDASELIQAETLANSLRQQSMVGDLDVEAFIKLVNENLASTKWPVPENLNVETVRKAFNEYKQLKKLWDGLEEREYLDLEWKD